VKALNRETVERGRAKTGSMVQRFTGSTSSRVLLAVCSDIHYAGPAEQRRGEEFEFRAITNPLLRLAFRFYRHGLWMRRPHANNHLLDEFLRQARAAGFEHAVGNGDFAADTAFLGLSDDAAFESASLCLAKLRAQFGENLFVTLGDHDLGKLSFFGHFGGLRLASWRRAHGELGLSGFWRRDFGRYVLLGVASSLVALPVFEPDALPAERAEWERLRAGHLAHIREAFAGLAADQRVILFCHDPTALPFLGRDEIVRSRLSQVELTVIGHLHSNLILWKSGWLAGIPRVTFLGANVRRITGALREARAWRPFRVRLCPAPAGIQIQRGGGWCSLELDPEGNAPLVFRTHPLRRRKEG
jgi:hypothetical protein